MQFGILGPLTVWRQVAGEDPEEIPIPGARLRRALALLLLAPGRPVSIDRMQDGIWGEEVPDRADNALQALVSRLRSLLQGEVALVRGADAYRLEIGPDQVDAARFERLLAQGRATMQSGDVRGTRALLSEAQTLWRGDPLQEFGEGGPLGAARLRLRELGRGARQLQAEARLQLGERDGLVPELEALAAVQPLDEALLATLLRALAAEGRRAEALARFEEFRVGLREHLGIDPSPELQQLHAALLRQEPRLTSPTAPAAPVDGTSGVAPTLGPTNLRARLTSFVGRQVDEQEVISRLRSQRLVTLVGPGGAGKTRLAEEVASSCREAFPGGVWLVSLASIRDAAELPRIVLSTLARHDGSLADLVVSMGGDVMVGLVAALQGRRLLLLLDNCEHLVGGVAVLVETLLGGTDEVVVLATSREPLGVPGETLWPVSSLDVPEAGAEVTTAHSSSSVQLFCDRARAVQPAFRLDGATLPAVLRICRDLDGLPLAIELAAARLRSLSVAQIAERLADRFRLLNAGSRTALPRHQTLRAVVDWSWQLLEPSERMLLRRLSVFVGSPHLDAIEDVCAGLPEDGLDKRHEEPPGEASLPRDHVLEVLGALVDRSLVTAMPQGSTMRYRLLETVRAYATERLEEAGEAARLGRSHAKHYLRLAQAADRALHGPEQLAGLNRLDRESADLRAAMQWSLGARDALIAVRLGTALSEYCGMRGLRERARSWLAEALTLRDGVPALVRADAHLALAASAQAPGGPSRGYDRRMLEAARQDFAEAGVAPGPLFELREMATTIPEAAAEPERAAALRERLGGFRERVGEPWLRGQAWVGEAFLSVASREERQRPAVMERALTEAAREFRTVGDDVGLSAALAGLAVCAGSHGDRAGASALLDDAFARALRLGWTENLIWTMIALSAALSFQGLSPDLLPLLERGLAQAQEQGSSDLGIAGGYLFLGSMAQRRGDVALARRCYELALCRTERLEQAFALPMRAFGTGGLSWVKEREGDHLGAWSLNRQAVETLLDGAAEWTAAWEGEDHEAERDERRVPAMWLTGGCRQAARILVGLGELERAALLFGAAEAMLRLLPAEHQERARREQSAPDPGEDRAQEAEARSTPGGEEAFSRGLRLSPDEARAALLDWTPTVSS